MISTAVIQGCNTCRVGDVEFEVQPGDVYAISKTARYDVEHEVMSDYVDRVSVTLRFGINPTEI